MITRYILFAGFGILMKLGFNAASSKTARIIVRVLTWVLGIIFTYLIPQKVFEYLLGWDRDANLEALKSGNDYPMNHSLLVALVIYIITNIYITNGKPFLGGLFMKKNKTEEKS